MPTFPPNPLACFWQNNPHKLHDHRSTEDLPTHSDVVIIGAGYAGVSTAWHLLQNHPNINSITILEARGACSGATGRNGGHLRPDLYGHIPTYIDRAGPEAAAEIAEFEIAHVQAIKKLVESEHIDCDFRLTRTIDVWCNEKAAEGARKVYERMKGHGFAYMDDVDFHAGKNVEGICGVKGALACASYTAATIWPYKFIMHLLAKLLASGNVNLQTHTPATAVTPSADGKFTIDTPRGTLHANKVIHTSNAYVSSLLPQYKHNIIPCKGICCRITVPEGQTAPLLTNSYIDRTKDNVLSYLIPRADGSIIVGGASALFKPRREQWYNNTDDSVLIDAAKDFYDGYMQRTFRGWEESGARVDQIWTGVMGYSYDSNPHVGAVPECEGQFILAGLNGHGMPVVWLAAEGLARMVGEGVGFEETGMPRLFKTTKERIERAQRGKEEEGDILGTGSFPATKQ
ncbi:NAD(P)/FAD-dependent oxidoreductase [Aspergillus fischeri NRRL 181]|uniref:FAD dependent oxidoreductase superfamily n=1 Tax=Neosartorya fischeri (strain ATCC 1020 / DSM 3700 / CBS 544.65 / FGSC A1164 / JCM 1740 / NRRL 181 / WB 181) TaxID=331117 RepID=A1DBJ2_NEOFI|nr:FAD dependent oxidoreductase superfamily [Aspergillus fischeri NRRL 181]EAW20232.1 FAD dependent oxidoreductase superfamily [Aspergillus fischeri NRRL 181]